MSGAAEQRSAAGLLLQWSEELGRWSGELEDGPFRLKLIAERRGGGRWVVLLRDLAGEAEMLRETIELQLPPATEATAIVERLQEFGDTWRQDPSLLFQGWGRS